MNRIKDYELKRGDWVQILDGRWAEYDQSIKDGGHHFHDITGEFGENAPVRAVLRPSMVLRDQLDTLLKLQRKEPVDTSLLKEVLEFEELEPKK